MKRIALIHTVKSLAVSFESDLRAFLGEEVKIHNLWDDFLADDPNEVGEFTTANKNRLFFDMKAQELTGADLIVTTCSTLTPTVEQIRPFIKTPVIAIDDAMAKKSVTFGERVLVLATAQSTVEPTVTKIGFEAKAANKNVTIETCVCMDAFHALKAMDMERHDAILKEKAKTLAGYDCIVLAQASMAHLEKAISEITGVPVLSSPRLCMEEIREKLEEKDNE